MAKGLTKTQQEIEAVIAKIPEIRRRDGYVPPLRKEVSRNDDRTKGA